MIWPSWWSWPLGLTPHVEERMDDRDFNELELRTMLHEAHDYRADRVPGRFIISCRLRRNSWHVIVEPDDEEEVLVVITAYPLEP